MGDALWGRTFGLYGLSGVDDTVRLARRYATGQPGGDRGIWCWIHRQLIGKKIRGKNAQIAAAPASADVREKEE